jgi:DNA-binding Lrp family transcriptional regulator
VLTDPVKNAEFVGSAGQSPKNVQLPLRGTDLAIALVLARDARTANNALAEEVGIAPSTCLGRVRALREAGVIRGYHADVDPAALGRPLRVMIAVRLKADARGRIPVFMKEIAALPEVLDVFFLGGTEDFLVHVAAQGTDDLRNFVVRSLSGNQDVAHTETNIVFEHIRTGPAADVQKSPSA